VPLTEHPFLLQFSRVFNTKPQPTQCSRLEFATNSGNPARAFLRIRGYLTLKIVPIAFRACPKGLFGVPETCPSLNPCPNKQEGIGE
jgi:hypothetical protein